jgi:hypothetical protein
MKLSKRSWFGSKAMTALLAAGVASAAQCGGNPVQPPPPPPNTAPVVRSVTASPTQVNAGQELEVTAVADDAQTTAEQLQYEWTAEPAGGTFTGQGRIVRWRAPTDGPVPSDYVIRVTVRDVTLSATMTTSPIRVNDGIREMRQLVETFLTDFASPTRPSPEFCVRNFTDTCRIGKQMELEDIRDNRRDYTIISDKHRIDEVVLNSGWVECTAPTGPQSCALVLSAVDWISTSNTTGALRRSRGDSVITGIYEQSTKQWWLCDSRYFEPPTTTQPLMPAFLR